jgi:hypothetical protein
MRFGTYLILSITPTFQQHKKPRRLSTQPEKIAKHECIYKAFIVVRVQIQLEVNAVDHCTEKCDHACQMCGTE